MKWNGINVSPEIAEALKKARKEKGLTQDQVAEKLEIRHSTVVTVESGNYNCRINSISAMADLYGMKLVLVDKSTTTENNENNTTDIPTGSQDSQSDHRDPESRETE